MITKHTYLASLLTLAPYFKVIVAQASTSNVVFYFSYPETVVNKSTEILVNVIDTVVVEWTSNFEDTWLWLWCYRGDPNLSSLDRCMSKLIAVPHAAANPIPKGLIKQYRQMGTFHTRLASMALWVWEATGEQLIYVIGILCTQTR
jgi:hypothetical protein